MRTCSLPRERAVLVIDGAASVGAGKDQLVGLFAILLLGCLLGNSGKLLRGRRDEESDFVAEQIDGARSPGIDRCWSNHQTDKSKPSGMIA